MIRGLDVGLNPTLLIAHCDSDAFKKADVVGTYGGIVSLLAGLLVAAGRLILGS